MKAHMAARLDELKGEYKSGEAQLRTLMEQQVALRETLLRISGAIQVLEELATSERSDGEGGEDEPGSQAQVLSVP